ncbi:MAG: hypothetical protein A2451_16100 [Bdellovibrionales bacterium RIFOXYC2_FULL_39_8]|nr:MAG: hypothetical protein A2451_16100 [Bdellovibrionales bacterium RIFOXYC2_FULL_39_8]
MRYLHRLLFAKKRLSANVIFMKKLHVFFVLLLTISLSPPPDVVVSRIPASFELNDIREFAAQQLTPAQNIELHILGENILRFIIDAAYRNDDEKIAVMKQAREYILKVGPQVASNILNNTQEGDPNYYKVIRPPAWTLKSEIEFLHESVSGLSISLSDEALEAITPLLGLINFKQTLPEIAREFAIGDKDLRTLVRSIVDTQIDDEQILNLMQIFEKRLMPYFDRIKAAGDQLGKSDKITFYDQGVAEFVKKFINFYYSNINIDVQKDIISDLLRLGKDPADEELIRVMFNNAGPGLGKSLQQFAKEPSMDKSMRELIGFLESEGKAVPYHLVKRVIENDPGRLKFTSIEEKPLGTGTVAQVHRAKLQLSSDKEQEVAIRFLKPNVERRAQDDIALLKKFIEIARNSKLGAKIPDISELLSGAEKFLSDDLDIPGTIDKQLYAKNVYENSMKVVLTSGEESLIHFKVPNIYLPAENRDKTRLMALELISGGTKFEKLSDPGVQESVSRGLVRLWFTEAIFKSGFIHADLHQGNFVVFINQSTKDIDIVIFDYGMSEKLDNTIRRSFILIGAGAELEEIRLIAKGAALLSQKSEEDIFEFISSNSDMMGKKFPAEKWITWLTKKGILTSDKLAILARGGQLVSQLPAKLGRTDIAKEEIKRLAITNIKRSIYDRAVQLPINLKDFYYIGKTHLRSKCATIFSSLMGRKSAVLAK